MELTADQLRRQADPGTFGFRTTAEVEPATVRLGQRRAEHALQFAMTMRFEGYNLYALGSPQLGMHEFVQSRLESLAKARDVPDDWCYLNNFDDPSSPRVCRLPAGMGRRFKRDVADLIAGARTRLPAALASDDFRSRAEALGADLQQRQAADSAALQQEAEAHGLTMLPTPQGFVFAPLAEGRVMDQAAFASLPEERRREIQQAIERLNASLVGRLREYPRIQEELTRKRRELLTETASGVLRSLAARLRSRYQTYPAAIAFVVAAEADLLENVERIIALERADGAVSMAAPPGSSPGAAAEAFFRRYLVNLLVDNADLGCAPVVYESNPSLDNLLGKAEHRFEYGSPVTDFTMIRPGALHRANGGYLLIDAERVLQKPFAWEALKRAIADRCLRLESISRRLDLAYSVSLEPEPVEIAVKVVLLGNRRVFHLLREYDTDFDDLFKIVADFDDDVSWDDDHQQEYAQLLARLVTSSRIRHLTGAAVASVLEHSSRLVGDQRRLSARVKDIEDILREADHLAAGDGAELIDDHHVDDALLQRAYRVDRIRELVHENITRGVVQVQTTGSRVGQVNGLSVASIGKLVFGQPSRITATARLGRGELLDIEREAGLGGRLHSKAVLIVASFIGARYARDHPLSLEASLVFEQSYGGIEGDSASVAEVCALLSAIADAPVRQDIAITGSMDQHGAAQAIGGVNEKIEGFFDVCREQGLSGTQGVLIPRANLNNLMLRQDVVDAVSAGTFHIYAMTSVDDAIALLFAPPEGPAADPAAVEAAVSARIRNWHELHLQSLRAPRDEA